MVGTGGFEPPAPCSQGRCADQTALRPEVYSLNDGDVVSQGRVQCKVKTHRAERIAYSVKEIRLRTKGSDSVLEYGKVFRSITKE